MKSGDYVNIIGDDTGDLYRVMSVSGDVAYLQKFGSQDNVQKYYAASLKMADLATYVKRPDGKVLKAALVMIGDDMRESGTVTCEDLDEIHAIMSSRRWQEI